MQYLPGEHLICKISCNKCKQERQGDCDRGLPCGRCSSKVQCKNIKEDDENSGSYEQSVTGEGGRSNGGPRREEENMSEEEGGSDAESMHTCHEDMY